MAFTERTASGLTHRELETIVASISGPYRSRRDGRAFEVEASILEKSDVHEAASLSAEVFLQSEPMTRTLLENARLADECNGKYERDAGPNVRTLRRDMHEFTKLVCTDAEAAGISIVARDRSSGKMIGFSVNEIYANGGEPPPFPRLGPVFAHLEQHKKFYVPRRAQMDGYRGAFHLLLAGTEPAYFGMGLPSKLLEGSIMLARALAERGRVSEVVGEATSGSQGIFRDKFEFQTEHAVSYGSVPEFGENMRRAEAKWQKETNAPHGWPESSLLMTLALRASA